MPRAAEPARRVAPGLAALLLLASAVSADTWDELHGACTTAHADDPAALTRCLQDTALAQNLRMDALYSGLRTGLTGDPARRLLNAQRAFVRFRDLHCTAIGRTMDPAAWQACNLRLTLERIAQLERYPEP